jgi:hypothetical protein
MSLTLTTCPECGAVAEVIDEGCVGSTGGAVRMVRVNCVRRHWFLMAEDGLARAAGGRLHTSAPETAPGPFGI